jgi:hypothetical protein
MNLHGFVSGVIGAINPNILVIVKKNTGYTTNADFTRTPSYTVLPDVSAQVQGVKAKEIEHMQSMNIAGVLRSVHLNGDWETIQRANNGAGGDRMHFGGYDWLVVWVYETWPDWSRVIVQQQTQVLP